MTYPPTMSTHIRTAKAADQETVCDVLVEAFLHGDLAPWLIMDLDTRRRVYRPYFAMLAEHALGHAHVEITTDGAAVAVWHPIADGPLPPIRDYDTRLAQITGPFLWRFAALDAAVEDHHPYDRRHHYLAFLAVHPNQQHRGLGSALLAYHHAALDRTGTPAYLEATGVRNRGLYAWNGYRPRPAYRIAGDGPTMFPMWRPPVAANDNVSVSVINRRSTHGTAGFPG